MSNLAKKFEALTDEQRAEFLEMEAQLAAIQKKQRAILNTVINVVPKTYTTKEGKTGIILHGLGKAQFFYKNHLRALVGESEACEKVRRELREWMDANDAVLSDKEEE